MSEFSKFVACKSLILSIKNEYGRFMSFIEIYGRKRKPERLL